MKFSRKETESVSKLRFNLLFLSAFIFLLEVDLSQEKIQEWERKCVVGECVQSASRSCLSQSLDIKLGHPTQKNVRSESIFRNRPSTLAAEPCSIGSSGGHHRHENDRRGRRQTAGDGVIPLCCPEKKTREGMLVAGLGAGANEFPHQVRILIKAPSGVKEKCGGTIYNKDYILTAASCFVYNGNLVAPSDVEVITGQNLEHTRISKNIHTVRVIKIHEGYKGTIHSYGRDDDIALLRLRTPLDFTVHRGGSSQLKALRIPEKGFRAEGRRAIILGWGRTALDEKPIGALLKMNAHINTHEECTQKSKHALHNGNDLRKVKLEEETPHDEFGIPDTFDLSKPTFSSKFRSRNRNSGFGSGRHSLFEDDPFFSRNWGTSLAQWDKQHNVLVKMGALNLGKLWEGGVEYPNKHRENIPPFSQVPPSILCIGGGEESKGYNRGDSGGPAICEGADGSPVLCGISSYGRNEFRGEWPASYVNLANYIDWVHSNTGRGRQPEDILIKDIIDGEPISLDEATFFIRIRNKKTNKTCGGVLITSNTVISSSSCVPIDARVDDLGVTSGELTGDQRGVEHEVEGVASRETYRNYRPRSENRRGGSTSSGSAEIAGSSLKGDFPQLNLAVLKLARPVLNVKPIDLIKPRMERMIVYEFGWRTDERDKSLNKWKYREVPSEECKERYGSVGILVDEHHLCAAETYSGGENCNKELGNPLVCVDRQGRKYLCGVTGYRDCSYNFPTIFTNVVENLDWIQL